jgi:hypothetical protein
MSTNFPTSLDSYAALVDGTDILEAADQNNVRDAVEAIEAKVGINGSAVTTSHDYKIDALENAWTPAAYTTQESITFPNNFILKRGTGTTGTAVTFGAAFPNAAQAVFCTFSTYVASINGFAIYVGNLTASGFTPESSQNAKAIYWMAIGY